LCLCLGCVQWRVTWQRQQYDVGSWHCGRHGNRYRGSDGGRWHGIGLRAHRCRRDHTTYAHAQSQATPANHRIRAPTQRLIAPPSRHKRAQTREPSHAPQRARIRLHGLLPLAPPHITASHQAMNKENQHTHTCNHSPNVIWHSSNDRLEWPRRRQRRRERRRLRCCRRRR
jgi:hypothetical protein